MGKKLTLVEIILISLLFCCNLSVNAQLKNTMTHDTLLQASDFTAKVYGFAPFSLHNKSGKTLKYSSSNPAVATVADSTVTIKGAGKCNIYAKVASDTTIRDTAILTVHKKNLDISTPSLWCHIGEKKPTIVIIYSGFIDGENENNALTVKPVALCPANMSVAGSYNITLSGGTSSNYSLIFDNTSKIKVVGAALEDGIDNVSLYPNPASDIVTISGISVPVLVEISNIVGNIVRSVRTDNGAFNVDGLPAGVYFVKITAGTDIIVKKIIVE